MTLGNNIKRIRKEAKLSQEDFAEKFCVTRQTVSNWENSKSYPDLETIIRISDSFEISLDILLKEDITMVKTIDHEVKSTRKYTRALTVIAFIVVLLIVSFAVYSMVYFDAKKNLENNFEEQLEENDFYKNRDGYYTMNYADGVYYSVPNQSMPSLLDFDLHYNRIISLGAKVTTIDVNITNVSSTQLRKNLDKNLLPAKVYEYIMQKEIYNV